MTVALREIKHYQRNTDLLIPKAPFKRLINHIMHDAVGLPFRISESATAAIHEATEMFIIEMFKDMHTIARNAERVTVNAEDCKTARSLCANSTAPVSDPWIRYRT